MVSHAQKSLYFLLLEFFFSGLKVIESEHFQMLQGVFFGMWIDIMNSPLIYMSWLILETTVLVQLVSRF